jgi:putative cardiolipin synthase
MGVRNLNALRLIGIVFLSLIVAACASKKVEPYPRPAPQSALPAAPGGPFAEIETTLRGQHGAEASGFELIDRNEDGLRWRLALIDSARQSIDVQYYLWYGDAAGRILVKRLLDAADRGVRVRMLVDDLNTLLADSGTVKLRDDVAAAIDAHPNFEIRLFNPWKDRTLGGRAGESLAELGRVNQRMHNKAMIVDNRAVILGGRNIGDDYMGLHAEFNFHDLDVLGIGPVARQTSTVFDLFWNSEWVMPASALRLPTTPGGLEAARERLVQQLEKTASLERFPIAPQSWSAELAALPSRLHIGTSRVETDRPTDGSIHQDMLQVIFALMQSAQRELLIVNAYIIPGDHAIDVLQKMHDRGVTMKILTNSLASHDVPAVNSHYKQWRKALLAAGVELHEIRHDAAIQPLVSDTPPTHAKFMGLHSKAMVVDRQHVYIGSMNFDPRSAFINTEMGLIVDSAGLAGALAALIERDMQPVNSWRVELDGAGGLRWTNDRETVSRQPARSWWQRVEDVVFMMFPKEYY